MKNAPLYQYLVLVALVSVGTVVAYRSMQSHWLVLRDAEARYTAGDHAGAIPGYRTFLHKRPDHRRAWTHLIDCLEETGQTAEAIALYHNWLARYAGDFWLHVELGGIHARHREFSAAVTAYRAALALKPDDRDTRIYLARNLTALGRHDEAIREYRILLGEVP